MTDRDPFDFKRLHPLTVLGSILFGIGTQIIASDGQEISNDKLRKGGLIIFLGALLPILGKLSYDHKNRSTLNNRNIATEALEERESIDSFIPHPLVSYLLTFTVSALMTGVLSHELRSTHQTNEEKETNRINRESSGKVTLPGLSGFGSAAGYLCQQYSHWENRKAKREHQRVMQKLDIEDKREARAHELVVLKSQQRHHLTVLDRRHAYRIDTLHTVARLQYALGNQGSPGFFALQNGQRLLSTITLPEEKQDGEETVAASSLSLSAASYNDATQ